MRYPHKTRRCDRINCISDGVTNVYRRAVSMVATGTEPAKTLRAHQAQLLLAAGNPDTDAPPVWRPVNT